MDRKEILNKIKEFSPWYHNIDLGNGIWTGGFKGEPEKSYKCTGLLNAIPKDLTGKTVLDLGCNAGFFSLICKERGAKYVLGIDYGDVNIERAKFCANVRNLDIEYRLMSVYDVSSLNQKFDLVLFIGLLYHLEHDKYKKVLDDVSELCKDIIIFETIGYTTELKNPIPMVLKVDDTEVCGHQHMNVAAIEEALTTRGFKHVSPIFVGGRTAYIGRKV